MPTVKITETTNVNNKVFFPGDAEVSEQDAKALETRETQAEETEAPKSKGGKGK